jgi:hypothetical protein
MVLQKTSLLSRKGVREYFSASCYDPTQEYGKFSILYSPAVLADIYRESEDILVVSDGSTVNGTISFGLVISAYDDQRLASRNGRVAGHGTSRRAEARRMLCILRFVSGIHLWVL